MAGLSVVLRLPPPSGCWLPPLRCPRSRSGLGATRPGARSIRIGPPPASVKQDQILRQPGAQTFGNAAQNIAPPTDGKGDGKEAPKGGPKTIAEREMEFRKRMQGERGGGEKAGRRTGAQRATRHRVRTLRGYLKALEEGQRIARTDAKAIARFSMTRNARPK